MDDSTLNPPLHDHGQDESKNCRGLSLPAVLYKECVRNINAENGGDEVHDGCREFAAAGKDGSPEALQCAACGCHRNFHQQESETPAVIKASDLARLADDIRKVVTNTKRKDTHRGINVATQILEEVSKLLNILAQVIDEDADTRAKRQCRWLLLWRLPRTKLRARMMALQRRSERGPLSAPSRSPSSKLWPRVCSGLWETYPRINRRVLRWTSG